MSSTDRFFNDYVKRAQSALKHAILADYLATFSGATGTNSPGHRVGYLDGYAGPGEYDNGGVRVSDGSPKIALRIAENHKKAARPRFLECIFVEKKEKYFVPLKALADAAPPAKALHGDIKNHLKPALAAFDGIPALVFLDPFGAALDRDASIEAILTRPGDQPTELLLNFSMQTVRRMGGRINEPEGAPGREATLVKMDRWLGGDWWRQMYVDAIAKGGPDPIEVATVKITNEYARRVIGSTKCNYFPVAMRAAATHKPLFMLMLFFPRNLAAFKYNESVSRAQQKWREIMWGRDIEQAEHEDEINPRMGMSYADEIRQIAQADKVQFMDDTVADIKENIQKVLLAQPQVSVQHEFFKVFGKAAGQGHTPHLRRAWKELGEAGVTEPVIKGDLDKATIRRAGQSPTFI